MDIDYCMYGAPYKKRTRLLTLQWRVDPSEVDGMLSSLGRKCDGLHEHVVLSGWGKAGQKSRPTKGTAKYPAQLAQSWARAMAHHILH